MTTGFPEAALRFRVGDGALCYKKLPFGSSEEDTTFSINGWIRLPAPQLLDGATAIVGIDDVSMIDARSVRVAETVIAPVSGTLDRIPFSLAVPESLPRSASYRLSAEIRRSRPEALSRGDFLTTTAVPWTEGKLEGHVVDVCPI
jgi:hypothetical protein